LNVICSPVVSLPIDALPMAAWTASFRAFS
jgi:hypothetical protein